jgi:hypothetical protein
MKSYNNLPQEQHPVQHLVDQFNADERRWQDLRREILKVLRNIIKINRRGGSQTRP